jgi:uncharacterized membrane protein
MAVLIEIPNLPANLSQSEVIQSLVEDLGPRFAIYVISFFVIGLYWISYHQILSHIVGSHVIIVWLNLVFLFFITIIPFAVNLQVDYGFYQVIFILYALVLTFGGLTLIWLHARKNRLIDNTVSHIEIQNVLLESILLPSVFVISILISIVDLQIAYYFDSMMVIIPAKIIIRKRYP